MEAHFLGFLEKLFKICKAKLIQRGPPMNCFESKPADYGAGGGRKPQQNAFL